VPALFLPFTANGQATENRAIAVKERIGLSAYDPVDPFQAVSALLARLVDPNLIRTMCPTAAEVLFGSESHEWSAVCLGPSPCDGREMILINPMHHKHRQRASLMEEIVHIALNHPRTLITAGSSPSGSTPRSHDAQIEDEAYNVGAACLIPYRDLFRAVKTHGETAAAIAVRYGLSEAYVDYRIRRSGLSAVYKRQQLPYCKAKR
jgi:hypothetical protein